MNDNYQRLQSLCVIWMREPLPFFFSSTEEEWRRVLDERERRKTLLIYFISNGCRCFRATTDIFFPLSEYLIKYVSDFGGLLSSGKEEKTLFCRFSFRPSPCCCCFPFRSRNAFDGSANSRMTDTAIHQKQFLPPRKLW